MPSQASKARTYIPRQQLFISSICHYVDVIRSINFSWNEWMKIFTKLRIVFLKTHVRIRGFKNGTSRFRTSLNNNCQQEPNTHSLNQTTTVMIPIDGYSQHNTHAPPSTPINNVFKALHQLTDHFEADYVVRHVMCVCPLNCLTKTT